MASKKVPNDPLTLPLEAPFISQCYLPEGIVIPYELWEVIYAIIRDNCDQTGDEWMTIQRIQVEYSRRVRKALSVRYLQKLCGAGIKTYKQFFVDNPWTDYKVTPDGAMHVKLLHPSLRPKQMAGLSDIKPQYYPEKVAIVDQESGVQYFSDDEDEHLPLPPQPMDLPPFVKIPNVVRHRVYELLHWHHPNGVDICSFSESYIKHHRIPFCPSRDCVGVSTAASLFHCMPNLVQSEIGPSGILFVKPINYDIVKKSYEEWKKEKKRMVAENKAKMEIESQPDAELMRDRDGGGDSIANVGSGDQAAMSIVPTVANPVDQSGGDATFADMETQSRTWSTESVRGSMLSSSSGGDTVVGVGSPSPVDKPVTRAVMDLLQSGGGDSGYGKQTQSAQMMPLLRHPTQMMPPQPKPIQFAPQMPTSDYMMGPRSKVNTESLRSMLQRLAVTNRKMETKLEQASAANYKALDEKAGPSTGQQETAEVTETRRSLEDTCQVLLKIMLSQRSKGVRVCYLPMMTMAITGNRVDATEYGFESMEALLKSRSDLFTLFKGDTTMFDPDGDLFVKPNMQT